MSMVGLILMGIGAAIAVVSAIAAATGRTRTRTETVTTVSADPARPGEARRVERVQEPIDL